MKIHNITERMERWLLPVTLILFILAVLLLPMAVGLAWADIGSPDHTLTYTANRLTWDSATGIRADGTAVLDLFDTEYDGSEASGDGSNLIAPGTGKSNQVRLRSNAEDVVFYTAVLYKIQTGEDLPVEVTFSGQGGYDTTSYTLPQGMEDAEVIGATTGIMYPQSTIDFTIDWKWEHDIDAAHDSADTEIGSDGQSNQMSVGFYVVVEDYNDHEDTQAGDQNGDQGTVTRPTVPKTGDEAHVELYAGLLLLCGLVLTLLWRERRRNRA